MSWFRSTPEKSQGQVGTRHASALQGDQTAVASATAQFLLKTNLFDRDVYLRNEPNARAGMDALHQYLQVGIQNGRPFTSVEAIARLWREVLSTSKPPELPPADLADPTAVRAAIYVSSLGNFFMREIADILAAGFADAGVSANVVDEKTDPVAGATHHIVIAPHEFFILGDGKKWATDQFLSRAILFSTEQVQTQWFARSLIFLLRAKAVADMNEQTAAILRKGGIRAECVQPGYSQSFTPFNLSAQRDWPPALASLGAEVRKFDVTAPWDQRPLDVVFLGGHSARRERLLASYASKFAEFNNFIYCTRTAKPLDQTANPTANPEVTSNLLARSKVLINVHRDDYTYFEFWRLMQAFWHGAPVVTEPCFPHPVFKAHEHYFEEAPRHIHHLVDWLIRSKDGQQRAVATADRARQALKEHVSAKTAALRLIRLGAS